MLKSVLYIQCTLCFIYSYSGKSALPIAVYRLQVSLQCEDSSDYWKYLIWRMQTAISKAFQASSPTLIMIDSCTRHGRNTHIHCRLLYDEVPFGNRTNIQILLRNKNDHSVTGDLSGLLRKEFQLNKIEKRKQQQKSKEINKNNNGNVWSAPEQSRLRVNNCSIGKINGDEGELVYDYTQSLIKTICCFICNRGPSLQRMSTREVIALYHQKRLSSRRSRAPMQKQHIRNVSAMKQAYKYKHKKQSDTDRGTHRVVPSVVSQTYTKTYTKTNTNTPALPTTAHVYTISNTNPNTFNTTTSNNVYGVPPPTLHPSAISTNLQPHHRFQSNVSQSASNNISYNYNGYRSNSPPPPITPNSPPPITPKSPNQSGYGTHRRFDSAQSVSVSHSGNGAHRRYGSNQSVPPNRPLPNLLNSPSGSIKYRPPFGSTTSPSAGNRLGGPQSGGVQQYFVPIEEEKENDLVGGYSPYGGLNNPDDEDMYNPPDVVEEEDDSEMAGRKKDTMISYTMNESEQPFNYESSGFGNRFRQSDVV